MVDDLSLQRPNVLWVQSLVYDPVLGKRLTPPRPIWNDLVCAFYDTFSSHPVGSPAQVPFWSWGNGNIIIDNVYQFTPGGGPPSVQMRPAVFSCLAGGMGLDTRPFASGQFAMNYWFAVDGTDTPGTCHDFRHKLMITPGGTTTGVRTIFEVKNDGSLIFHGTGTAMNTGKKLEFADSGNSWSGKWYVVTVHYAQVTPGTTDLGRLKFRIADNAGNLVWSLVDNDLGPVWIDLNPNEATYKSVLWECGNGRSTVDEVSFHY